PRLHHRRSARAGAAACVVGRASEAGLEGFEGEGLESEGAEALHADRRSPVRVVYSSRYRIDIGLHVFPTEKYRLVHDRLIESGVIQPSDVVEPAAATWDALALVHTPEYLDKLRSGAMTLEDVAQLELPWSAEMVEGFRLMTGGTIEAARIAT